MATPIKETPTLNKKQWDKFEKILLDNEDNKISPERYKKATKTYNKMIALMEKNQGKTFPLID